MKLLEYHLLFRWFVGTGPDGSPSKNHARL